MAGELLGHTEVSFGVQQVAAEGAPQIVRGEGGHLSQRATPARELAHSRRRQPAQRPEPAGPVHWPE